MAKTIFEELGGKYERQTQRPSFWYRQTGAGTLWKAHRGYESSTGQTEQLKAENALEWTGRMNNIRACAMEIVNKEIIYV